MECEISAFEGESESGRSRHQNCLDESHYCDDSAEQAMHRFREMTTTASISEGNDSMTG